MRKYTATTSKGIVYTITVHDDGKTFMTSSVSGNCSLAEACFLVAHKYKPASLRLKVKDAAMQGVAGLSKLTGLYWQVKE